MSVPACGNCSDSSPINITLPQNNKIHVSQLLFTFHLELYLVALTCILGGLVVRYKRNKKGLTWIDKLSGPSTYPVIGGLHHFFELKRTFQLLLDWGETYGPIYKCQGMFNEPFIFLNDPNLVQAILSSNSLDHVSKPTIPYDSVFGQFLRNGLLVSKGEYWKSHRRLVARAFTYKSFQNYIKICNEHGNQLVLQLEQLFPKEFEIKGKICYQQISSLIHCCSLRIICSAVMGLNGKDGESGSDDFEIFNEHFQRYKIISSEKAMNPLFLIDPIWKLHPMSREYNQIIDLLNGIVRKTIEKRNKEVACPSGGEDFGARPCITMIDELLNSGMSEDEVLSEVNTVVAAGYESSSLTIHYLLFLLALNPECQSLCQGEIDEVFCDPVLHENGSLSMDALSQLKYLERCIMETLRLYPVIFLFYRKLETSIKLDENRTIPGGMSVIIPTYSIHRNPKSFPNPEFFDPDRFLPENVEKRHSFAYLPFSAGIRNCVGMKFAMMEIKAIAAYVLHTFHVQTEDTRENVPILPSIVMTPERDYMFYLKRRTKQ